MDADLIRVAQTCLDGAEAGTMTFPDIVGALLQEGFESYAIDFRRAAATYYRPDGDSVLLPAQVGTEPVAPALDAAALLAAIRDAQRLVPGYTYAGFCQRARAAGCACYLVSFPGRRAVYFGRDGAVHVEHFPT